jgi:hypothetical protein
MASSGFESCHKPERLRPTIRAPQPPTACDLFTGDGTSEFEPDIDRIATAGITFGCTRPPTPGSAPTTRSPATKGLIPRPRGAIAQTMASDDATLG